MSVVLDSLLTCQKEKRNLKVTWAFFAVFFGFLLFLLAGCSSFRGPGKLNLNEEDKQDSSMPASLPYRLLHPQFQSSLLNPNLQRKGELSPLIRETFSLDWPVASIRLTQKFRPPSNPSHQGIDLSGKLSSPIFAAHDGVIIYTGKDFKGYGKMIIIEYSDQWATLYGHLHQFQVKTGDMVTKGQVIGKMGRTGRVSGVHLHFELIRDKQPIDPLLLLPWKGEIAMDSSEFFREKNYNN